MKNLQLTLKTTLALMGLFFVLGLTANAASLSVTTTADGGIGSLRQAIVDATTNAAANTVSFNIPITDPGYNLASYTFTITLLSPLPNIPLAPMVISNNQQRAVVISGSNNFRVFTLVNSAVLTVNNLTLTNGFSGDGLGGAVFMGNSATLNLNGSTVSNSTVAASGGGIYMSNSGTLTMNNSTVRGNTSGGGGGIYIFDSGTLNISNSTVSGNVANNGGNGGGIFNGTGGTINASNSTIHGNSAGGNGGGVYNSATITFTSNTVTANTALKGGGIYNNFVATLNNNLVASNSAGDGADLVGRGSLGQAYTGTYNFVGNADGSEGFDGTSILGTTGAPIAALLGPLQYNGGATFTRALLHGSPALDKGNSSSLITDQRGQVRPYDNPLLANAAGGNGADMGAFEVPQTPSADLVTIGGRVTTSGLKGGRNLYSSRVSITDVNGNVRSAVTNSFGYYSIEGFTAGETYMLTVTDKNYHFAPQAMNVSGSTTEFNATAQPSN
jgi:hypothetical protein